MINEEISTIFVVGFPEDMQEREFQNMFMFARGFEAATLKIPQKDSPADENDDESSANGSSGTGSTRKQIIGFAKFRSRSEALEARDVLSGRKVDAEKGSVLKAEMAKKNLHTKRGLSNDQNNVIYPLIPATKQFSTLSNINTNTVNYDAYQYGAPALPSDLLSPQDYGYDDFYSDVSVYTPTTPTTPVFPDQSPFARGSFDATNGTPIGGLVGAPRSLINGAGVRYNTKAFLENDELNYLPKSNPVEILPQKVSNNGFQSALLVNDELSNRVAVQLMMNSAQQQIPPTGISPSPALSSPAFRPLNPADQNPPCNTLYVGNLPMNTNEDELKELFSKCPGYKRMCFRTKQNGPICFVEFEDVNYATQAMTSLYGSFLSNSIKSGIRLSFSKNPLGVRSNNGERRGSNFSLDSRRDSWNSFDSTINFERRGSFDNFLQRRGSGFLESQNVFNAEHRRSSTASFLLNERRESNYSPFDY